MKYGDDSKINPPIESKIEKAIPRNKGQQAPVVPALLEAEAGEQ